MSLIEMIRKHILSNGYDVVNEYLVYKSSESDQDCLIVKNKHTGVPYKISVEEWDDVE